MITWDLLRKAWRKQAALTIHVFAHTHPSFPGYGQDWAGFSFPSDLRSSQYCSRPVRWNLSLSGSQVRRVQGTNVCGLGWGKTFAEDLTSPDKRNLYKVCGLHLTWKYSHKHSELWYNLSWGENWMDFSSSHRTRVFLVREVMGALCIRTVHMHTVSLAYRLSLDS